MTEQEALKIVANPHLKWKCVEVDSALTIVRNALEKQTAEKVGNIDDYENHFILSEKGFLLCVDTNKEIRYPLISLKDLDYCPRCGQKLDWSDV